MYGVEKNYGVTHLTDEEYVEGGSSLLTLCNKDLLGTPSKHKVLRFYDAATTHKIMTEYTSMPTGTRALRAGNYQWVIACSKCSRIYAARMRLNHLNKRLENA